MSCLHVSIALPIELLTKYTSFHWLLDYLMYMYSDRKNQLLHLPPIDAPDTPKIKGAKKIINRGDKLMENAKGFEKKKG